LAGVDCARTEAEDFGWLCHKLLLSKSAATDGRLVILAIRDRSQKLLNVGRGWPLFDLRDHA
jgi:hypothetical protein